MTTRRTLYFARHAAVLAEPGRCYGATDLPACADDTQRAAVALGSLLKPHEQALQVYCSPLRRCRQLLWEWLRTHAAGGALGQYATSPVVTTIVTAISYMPALREIHFGAWEGQLWDAIGKQAVDDWTLHFADARAGGTGESVTHVLMRVARAYLDTQRQCQQRDQHALWVSHVGVYRALRWLLADTRRLAVYAALAQQHSRRYIDGGGALEKASASAAAVQTLSHPLHHDASLLPTASSWPNHTLPTGACVRLPL